MDIHDTLSLGVAGGISEAKKQSKETDESTCTEGSDEEYGQGKCSPSLSCDMAIMRLSSSE